MDKITLHNEEYIVSKKLLKRTHKHRYPKNWTTLWFYKDRLRTKINGKISCDKYITSKLEYQRGTFYKMSAMSREDPTFDYYFCLKPDVKTKNIIKRNGKHKGKCLDPNKRICHWKDYMAPLERVDGKIIVSF